MVLQKRSKNQSSTSSSSDNYEHHNVHRNEAEGRGRGRPLLEMSEEEQWNIINETGILHNIKTQPAATSSLSSAKNKKPQYKGGLDNDNDADDADAGGDVAFHASLMTIPLLTLYFALDYTVHQQYDFDHLISLKATAKRYTPLALVLYTLIYFTHKHKRSRLAQLLFTLLSIGAGVGLIYFSTEANQTFGNMKKTPGLAVLWIYTVVQLDLTLALVSLAISMIFFYKDSFLQIGESMKLK